MFDEKRHAKATRSWVETRDQVRDRVEALMGIDDAILLARAAMVNYHFVNYFRLANSYATGAPCIRIYCTVDSLDDVKPLADYLKARGSALAGVEHNQKDRVCYDFWRIEVEAYTKNTPQD